ncbi:MAG: hypothetical protein [Microvirus sp.]|nr:MAG: hypothetical protein [Microvirus sp.]
MRRSRASSSKHRRSFSRNSAPHPANTVKSVMRGGIRK